MGTRHPAPIYTSLAQGGDQSFGLIHTEPENFLSIRGCVRSANDIHKVAGNKPFEILLTSFSTVEKKVTKGMVISFATRSPVIHLDATRTLKSPTLIADSHRRKIGN